MSGKRIKKLIADLNHNPNSFAQEIGVASAVIYNIIGGRKNNPSFEVLEKIKSAFPQVNMNWVITGQGLPIALNNDEYTVQVTELERHIQQLSKLAKVRDLYIEMLKEKFDTIKKKRSVRKK